MKKLIVMFVAATIYLNPLYPVYALQTNYPTNLKPAAVGKVVEKRLDNIASREANIQDRMEDRKDKIATRVANLKDKWASREAALKDRLAKFKDRVKAQRAERVNSNLKLVNQKRIEMMKMHLEKLSQILEKIEDKVNEAAASGKDMTSAKSAISGARTAIQNAQVGVDAQADKDYTIAVTDEATVKTDAEKARNLLYTDLKTTQELLKTARTAVEAAMRAAIQAMGGGVSPTP